MLVAWMRQDNSSASSSPCSGLNSDVVGQNPSNDKENRVERLYCHDAGLHLRWFGDQSEGLVYQILRSLLIDPADDCTQYILVDGEENKLSLFVLAG
jgi:hypothetical protein